MAFTELAKYQSGHVAFARNWIIGNRDKATSHSHDHLIDSFLASNMNTVLAMTRYYTKSMCATDTAECVKRVMSGLIMGVLAEQGLL